VQRGLVLPTVALAVLLAAATRPAGGQSAAPLPPQPAPAPPQGMSMPADQGPSMPPPLPAGPAPDLDLVVTGQVAGWIEPCG
jgi:hypothetical protein